MFEIQMFLSVVFAFIEKHIRDNARRRGEPAPANDDDLEMALSYGKERAPPGYGACRLVIPGQLPRPQA
jgi:hypothetical protein